MMLNLFGFRPLAGVNYNKLVFDALLPVKERFRPLAGVNYNLCGLPMSSTRPSWFPSPCGGEL